MATPNESHIDIFFNWIGAYWVQIFGTIGGAVTVIGIIFRLGKRKKEYEELQSTVNLVTNNQKKVISLIPKESWEGGVMLVNRNDCHTSRVDCRTRILVDEYKETLDAVKQAVGVLIFHNKEIPEDERNKQIAALMK